jgi:hypothetical protein
MNTREQQLINQYKAAQVVTGDLLFLESQLWVFQNFNISETCVLRGKGIYFLRFGDYVVYVGMSCSSIYDRVFGREGHSFKKWIFNNIAFIPMPDAHEYDIREKERLFIRLFYPFYNSSLKCHKVGRIYEYEDSRHEDGFHELLDEILAIANSRIFESDLFKQRT